MQRLKKEIKKMINKKPAGWRDTYEYQRLIDILETYWLDEPREAYVECTLYFRHMDGGEQEKVIKWRNPAIRNNSGTGQIKRLVDVEKPNTYRRDGGLTNDIR